MCVCVCVERPVQQREKKYREQKGQRGRTGEREKRCCTDTRPEIAASATRWDQFRHVPRDLQRIPVQSPVQRFGFSVLPWCQFATVARVLPTLRSRKPCTPWKGLYALQLNDCFYELLISLCKLGVAFREDGWQAQLGEISGPEGVLPWLLPVLCEGTGAAWDKGLQHFSGQLRSFVVTSLWFALWFDTVFFVTRTLASSHLLAFSLCNTFHSVFAPYDVNFLFRSCSRSTCLFSSRGSARSTPSRSLAFHWHPVSIEQSVTPWLTWRSRTSPWEHCISR